MKKIKASIIILFVVLILINIANISAADMDNNATDSLSQENTEIKLTDSISLDEEINDTQENGEIILEHGTYKVNDVTITKNLTIRGNSDPRNVIIDSENKMGGIFHINSPTVHITFKNITFINGLTNNFGGAISIETGNVYVDNCIFINNSALEGTNAGGISNYGDKLHKSYLLVNNSLFINNHADHDGGAVTTCYASSDIYNSVFINNSAHRDGGAIRVSVEGYGHVEDCIFMYNHADEWGGAYYSWAGTSNINRCIFMNNTAGTHGGAVMVSGKLNLTNSVITDNKADKFGGSFFIRNPMFDQYTEINVHNNLITNNNSPNGKETFIQWDHTEYLFTNFDGNDWGDEDPNDSSTNDPNNVTSRIKVSKYSDQSNLLNTLNFGLLNQYRDLIGNYFPDDYFGDDAQNQNDDAGDYSENNSDGNKVNSLTKKTKQTKQKGQQLKDSIIDSQTFEETISNNTADNKNINSKNINSNTTSTSQNAKISGNSTTHGNDKKAYELNETGTSVSKEINNTDFRFVILGVIAIFLLLAIGYKREIKKGE